MGDVKKRSVGFYLALLGGGGLKFGESEWLDGGGWECGCCS